NGAIPANEYVVRLDVAVKNALLMHVLQAAQQINDRANTLDVSDAAAHGAGSHPIQECRPFHELHLEYVTFSEREKSPVANNVRMFQLEQRFGFALEPWFGSARRDRWVRRKNLERCWRAQVVLGAKQNSITAEAVTSNVPVAQSS